MATKRYININAKDSTNGKTSLIYAAEKDYVEVVKVLVGHKNIDLNVKDEEEKTALIHAAIEDHVEVVKVLVAKIGIDLNSKCHSSSPFSRTVASDNKEIITAFINRTIDDMRLNPSLPQSDYVEYLEYIISHNDSDALARFLVSGLPFHKYYTVEYEDLWRDALSRLSEEDRKKVLSERSWFGYYNEKMLYTAEVALPFVLNYFGYRNTLDSKYDGMLGRNINEGYRHGYFTNLLCNFDVNTCLDAERLMPFYHYDHLEGGLPPEVLGELGSHLMDPHPNIAGGYVNRQHHIWKKSISWKNIWVIPYAYFCSKLNNNIDFSVMSPWGNPEVLLHEIKSPTKLLNRVKDTIVGIAYDVGEDVKYVLRY